jgi:ubiquinone/menaquinone biosynthesis C-methylase UbiE
MRAEFTRRQPSVEVLPGAASDIPLPDASVDAVIVAQAWHWVDEHAASAEIARVLRPGGPVGIVWNVRDENIEWIGQMNQAVGRSDAVHASEADRPVTPNLTGPFTDLGEQTVPNQHALPNADAVANLAGTWSYVQTAPDPGAAMRTVRKIAAAHAAVDGTVVIPQVCVAFRAFRVA